MTKGPRRDLHFYREETESERPKQNEIYGTQDLSREMEKEKGKIEREMENGRPNEINTYTTTLRVIRRLGMGEKRTRID